MILRILLLVFNLALGSDDTFAFPDSIAGYDQFELAKCVTADGQDPTKLISYFLSEGPELCGHICSQQQSCSGFAFSHLEKDACELYILEEFHDDTVAFMSNPDGFVWETTGQQIDPLSVLSLAFGTSNDYANQGTTCTDFITIPYCMLWQEWRCYVRITAQPSVSPSESPSTSPSYSPSNLPSVSPSSSPSVVPSVSPSENPTRSPSTDQPSISPTSDSPSVQPSNPPTNNPTLPPTKCPTLNPTLNPTVEPTREPTSNPSLFPTTDQPSTSPTSSAPSVQPSNPPTGSPTVNPSSNPTVEPTCNPTFEPTLNPTVEPTTSPSMPPTTDSPSTSPTFSSPSVSPSNCPTVSPSISPTTESPSISPTNAPSTSPSTDPSYSPSEQPSNSPSFSPSVLPSTFPIGSPSNFPSDGPSMIPSVQPTDLPSVVPTTTPSDAPVTSDPSASPISSEPTVSPTQKPSDAPSVDPSIQPTDCPTVNPSVAPSVSPSFAPSKNPSSSDPSVMPTVGPSVAPTTAPTTDSPSRLPSGSPTDLPTREPSTNPTFDPTTNPTREPTSCPSTTPTVNPSKSPTVNPTLCPTVNPTVEPTVCPSTNPTVEPTFNPTVDPTENPSGPPSVMPSVRPSANPTVTPSELPSLSPTETNPCSGPSDFIIGSKYVDLVLEESSFSDADVLTVTLQVPQKFTIQRISFNNGVGSAYTGVDTAYWTMTTKPALDCLYYPQFVADWVDVQGNTLVDFTVVTGEDGVQYLFNRMTLELEETVYSSIHNYQFNRTVVYEMPFAIELQDTIELEVDMSMIIPTVSPTVNPSGAPTVTPSSSPSTSPSGAPTLKAMDHLFTRYALYAPDVNGNSLVDINFTSIVRLPWTVQDQEFYIIDDEDDAMVDGSEVFTLIDDCYSAFKYEAVDGLCADENFRYPPSVYADNGVNADLCKHICDQTDACEAYDTSSTFDKCSIVGAEIDQSFATSLASYLSAGESWTYIGTTGGSPTQGRPIPGAAPGTNTCFIKQTAAWQTELCHGVNGQPPHPQDVPECYCYQEWNLKYISGNVCDVSGWWTLGMTIESSETGNNLLYETRVWVGLTSACAEVIGSSEICYDEAPCSVSGYDEEARITPMSKFYVTEQAYFQMTVGANAPIANIEVLDMKLRQQNGGDEVTVPSSDYRTDNVVSSQVDGFENRFTATVDLTVDVNDPTFKGTIAGVASWLTVTVGITYEDGVTRRRQLSVYSPEGDEPSVDLEIQILVYPKRCLEPEGNLGSHLVRTCPQGKTIRVCRANGWETLVSECPDEESNETTPEDTSSNSETTARGDDAVKNTQQSDSQSTVIIENSSDNDAASLWKLLTVVAAACALLVVCILWYCKQKEHEEEERKIVQKTIQVQEDSEWDTENSITDTSYYQDKANQEFAMKMAYEQIFQQYATYNGETYAPSTSGIGEESDV